VKLDVHNTNGTKALVVQVLTTLFIASQELIFEFVFQKSDGMVQLLLPTLSNAVVQVFSSNFQYDIIPVVKLIILHH